LPKKTVVGPTTNKTQPTTPNQTPKQTTQKKHKEKKKNNKKPCPGDTAASIREKKAGIALKSIEFFGFWCQSKGEGGSKRKIRWKVASKGRLEAGYAVIVRVAWCTESAIYEIWG